ncbi:hypothetical protein DPMN_101205 [Dreissena polymorpha]|uniref:Uncharacterized protein n=1 Tax=Dreissena polymorpha TaxID=45954 RepID=A0A9D4LH36_DREPO|nr:hypothetical protein DPMN_101205 [Dreissena polymorpha]
MVGLKNAQDTLNDMKQVADESQKAMKCFVENFYQKHAAMENEDYERALRGIAKSKNNM